MRKTIVAGLCLLLAPLLLAQQTLNNDAVIKLVKSGLPEDLIITTINASPGGYDTSANGLIALKTAGVSDKVIGAVVLKASGSSSVPPPASGAVSQPSGGTSGLQGVPPAVDSVGVYYQDQNNGSWQEVTTEVVNFKTGGVVKHIASVGLIKGDVNGLVGGTHARLVLKMPASFIFYVPEGRSPGEYQLLRLRLNQTSREFRATTGGVAHESGGAIRDTVDYTTRKIAPRVYLISLGETIGKGEYGFLPPSDISSGNNLASSGKIYSFALGAP
jgi:hypothetical protein